MMNQDELRQLPVVLQSFMTYLEAVKGKSNLTVSEYIFDLRTFFRYLFVKRNLVDESISFDDIDISSVDISLIRTITLYDAYEFIIYCKKERHNGDASRARKVASLRTFFDYLTTKTNQLETNPLLQLSPPAIKRPLPKYLSLEECNQLLNVIDGKFKERDYAIIVLFMNCGLRLSELVGIDLGDIKQDQTLTVTGKGNKQRVLYLNDVCLEAIQKYLRVRPVDGVKGDDRNALFLSQQKRRISKQTVQKMIEKYLSLAGLGNKGYSTHTLRHTAATLMYQHANVDIVVLKEILGHENLNTTNIYTHLSTDSMKAALVSNPLNSKLKKSTKNQG